MQSDQKPFSTWSCDVCGDQIEDPGLGLLAWREVGGWDEGNPPFKAEFLVVHKNLATRERRCDPGNRRGYTESLELDSYLGDEGRARLLSYLSLGPIYNRQVQDPRPTILDFPAFVDLFHRFQTPWYEEARRYFDTAATQELLGDRGPVAPYMPQHLREVVEANHQGED